MTSENNILDVSYSRKLATNDQIYLHLITCDNYFTPPLSHRVDLKIYSSKIFANGTTFEAWIKGGLIGLVATYFSDPSQKSAYITNVSVDPKYANLGIAKNLMRKCFEFAKENNFQEMKLEVFKENQRLVDFYSRLNFKIVTNSDVQITMKALI
jgi:ribosomal protein S18 acetylase RimI-like enzyme